MSNKLSLARNYASLARQDVFAEKRDSGYTPVRGRIASLVLERHVDDVQPIGVYPLMGAMTQMGVIDLDDHDGSLGWPAMQASARSLMNAAGGLGLVSHPFRSGGGRGIHLWFVWAEPQRAAAVRASLHLLLNACNLSDGAGGVTKGQAEVYPRQSSVAPGKLGNLIALPGARFSAPLHLETLEPVGWDDIDPAEVSLRLSDSPPAVFETEPKPADFVRLDGDEAEVEAALGLIPSDDYWCWLRVGIAIKHAFGEGGVRLFDKWSAKSAKYGGAEKTSAFFAGLKPDGRLGLGTIFHLARESGWNGPSNPMIREMNARFGIYTHGRTTEIIVKGARNLDEIFLGKMPFFDRLAAEDFIERTETGEVRVSKAKAWMSHRKAAHYSSLIFDPALPPGDNGAVWNVWTGFAIVPAPGDWSLLKAHIFENICRGRAELYDWLLNWLALGVQKPGLVIGTAPVLVGFPGTGKGVVAHAYGSVWGVHYLAVTHAEHVTGRFSGHFFARRFVFVDEGIFGGNRKDAGLIKTRITEPTVVLERKGVDAVTTKNNMIFMIASNEASVVPADKGDRRWMVLEVSAARREDHAYFGAIMEQLDHGGREAMLYELLHRDLSLGPDPTKVIRTEALFEQMLLAQPAEVRYLHGLLEEGRLPQNWVSGPASTTIRAMLDDLHRLYRDAKYIDDARLGRFIKKVMPNIHTSQGGTFFVMRAESGPVVQRSTRYDFPALARAREAFANFVHMPVPWAVVDGWQQDPDPREGDFGGVL